MAAIRADRRNFGSLDDDAGVDRVGGGDSVICRSSLSRQGSGGAESRESKVEAEVGVCNEAAHGDGEVSNGGDSQRARSNDVGETGSSLEESDREAGMGVGTPGSVRAGLTGKIRSEILEMIISPTI